MKKSVFLGFLGLCVWSTTLQSCNKDNPSPNGCNNTDSTYVDSTENGNGTDSTIWTGCGDIDSTGWNGGNPVDSLPG